ncbi:hypothetical protein O6H91_19G003500 [Diphasiastrum complanatum]|uniref:Uncharacterized protein n=1 Tax=Diphasiastrum complanatum TaxID=34168 RepID=A0ACC2AS71_DIPCM|nr:hypothetical protein O6H91_19G003500 [Diphasiastrum complanatum]
MEGIMVVLCSSSRDCSFIYMYSTKEVVNGENMVFHEWKTCKLEEAHLCINILFNSLIERSQVKCKGNMKGRDLQEDLQSPRWRYQGSSSLVKEGKMRSMTSLMNSSIVGSIPNEL